MKDTVVVSFTGAGKEEHATQVGNEFLKLQAYDEFDTIYFTDSKRSWFNDVNIDDLIKQVEQYNRIITIGNSMGAFSAVMFSMYTKVDIAIAFATQYSVKPEIVPKEHRWDNYVKNIKTWKHPTLEFNDTTMYYFISGSTKEEMYHLDMIPEKLNIHKTVIAGEGHMISRNMKNAGTLYPLILSIIRGKYK